MIAFKIKLIGMKICTLFHLINVQHVLFFFKNFWPDRYLRFPLFFILILKLNPIWIEYSNFGHFWPNLCFASQNVFSLVLVGPNCIWLVYIALQIKPTFCHLWYDVGVFWPSKKCLKSASNQFFCFYPNRYSLDLSREIL